MASRFSDLDRPPLDERALQRSVSAPGEFVSALRVLPEVESTNTAMLAAAAEGAPHASVLVAEAQTAGRGRSGRTWTAPPRSGLFVSILVRPQDVPAARWGWLPLLAGVAARSAVSRLAAIDVSLKWPNDLVVTGAPDQDGPVARPAGEPDGGYGAGRKLGGILAERAAGPDPAVVIGLGLNVTLREAELPAPHATSIALEGGAVTDRDSLLRALLREFGAGYGRWARAAGDPDAAGLRSDYEAACATLGRAVRAELPGGASLRGEAVALDADGRLVVRTGDEGDVPIAAGDIVHLR
jgi:BirA family transcriptional regulator, biotin operon repressor / biotin---[acetyl-CoA-carboxylase] ligase